MNITEAIRLSGKTRKQICEESGISISLLSLAEKGKRNIGIYNIRAVADALGVTPSDIRPDFAALFADEHRDSK